MKRLIFPLLLIALLAAACQSPTGTPTVAPATSTPSVPASPTVAAPSATAPASATVVSVTDTPAAGNTQPAPTETPIHVDVTPAQLAAINALAGSLKIERSQITLVSTDAMSWPDGCLGVALPGVTCAQGPVAGFRILLSAGGKQYEYHTNQDGTSVISTDQSLGRPLQMVVRLADNSVQIVDTGVAARGQHLDTGLLPQGGAAGGSAYVLDFKDQPQAEMVNAAGVTPLAFVEKPNYGLPVWPGDGTAAPRLAWATSPIGSPAITQLIYANVDGTGLTAVLTETVAAGTPPYQLVAEAWSADGQSLYFSREPYGIGGYIPFAGASSLYRYSLADGSVTELLPFTPNGGKMICLDDLNADASLAVGHCVDPKTISVQTLPGGAADQTISAPGTVTDFRLVGGARFSPDGQRVAFALAKADPTAEQGWLAVSDSLNGQSTVLDTTDAGAYESVVAWLDDSTLLLQRMPVGGDPNGAPSLWTIGVDGGNLTKVADGTFLTFLGN